VTGDEDPEAIFDFLVAFVPKASLRTAIARRDGRLLDRVDIA